MLITENVIGRQNSESSRDPPGQFEWKLVDEKSRHFTTFITLWDLYQWTRIPFSLGNSSGNVQRSMESCLEGIRDNTFVQQDIRRACGKNLRTVFRRLRKHGVKLKPGKYRLFQHEVCYFGRIVNQRGHSIYSEGTKPATNRRETNPKTVGDVQVDWTVELLPPVFKAVFEDC